MQAVNKGKIAVKWNAKRGESAALKLKYGLSGFCRTCQLSSSGVRM